MSKMRKEEIIYLAPQELKFSLKMKRALKRMIMIVINPFTTYDEISSSPDSIGPILLITISILLTLLDRYLLHLYVDYIRVEQKIMKTPFSTKMDDYFIVNFVFNGTLPLNKTTLTSSLNILLNSLNYLLFITLLSILSKIIIIFLLSSLLSMLLKGTTRGMFIASCYTLSISLIQELIGIIFKMTCLSQVKSIVVIMPSDINQLQEETLVIRAISTYLSKIALYSKYFPLIGWFISLWYLVILVALFSSVSKLSLPKAIVSTVITFIISSIMMTQLYGILMSWQL